MIDDFERFINKLESDTVKIIYLAKISLLNFNNFPKNLPQSEIESYKKTKLEWKKKDDNSWIGSRLDISKSNTLNELIYLAHEKDKVKRKVEETKTEISKLNIESDKLEIQKLERLLEILNAPISSDLSYLFQQTILQQAVMMMFAKFEAYLQELLRFICNINNKVLLHKNLGPAQVSISTIILKVDSSDSLLDDIIDKHVIAFGHLSLKERIDYLKDNLKLNLNLNNTLLKNVYNAEQARHAFTHNNGFASSLTESKTNKDFEKNDYLQLDLEYCLALQNGLLSIFQQIIKASSEKFNKSEEI